MTKLSEALALIILLTIFAITGWQYAHLPEQIPPHINGANRQMIARGAVWLLPFVATNLYLLLSAASSLNKRPEQADSRQVAGFVRVGVMLILGFLAWRQAHP